MSRKAWVIAAPVATMLITFVVLLALHAANVGRAHSNEGRIGAEARP